MNQLKEVKINVDVSKIDNMKCFCGGTVFLQAFNLKYVSPLYTGDARINTVPISMWLCLNCLVNGKNTYYPHALPQEQIRKMRPKDEDKPDKKDQRGSQDDNG